jgi:hypothetical protein
MVSEAETEVIRPTALWSVSDKPVFLGELLEEGQLKILKESFRVFIYRNLRNDPF